MQFWLIFAQIWLPWQRPLLPKNSSSIFEFADPENYTLHAKSVSISCTELKSVQFWLIFAQNLVAMATPFAPLKIQITF